MPNYNKIKIVKIGIRAQVKFKSADQNTTPEAQSFKGPLSEMKMILIKESKLRKTGGKLSWLINNITSKVG